MTRIIFWRDVAGQELKVAPAAAAEPAAARTAARAAAERGTSAGATA
jgi:hypothetical protein